MPELPEVETIVRDLQKNILGQSFENIITSDKTALNICEKEFNKLKGAVLRDIKRHGKFLSLVFDNKIITIHLRMTGRVLLRSKNSKKEKFERVRLNFNNKSLIFADIRRFGKIWLCSLDNFQKETGICKLGFDALDDNFSFDYFEKNLKNKKGSIKKYLLAQNIVAGIGNIYADEILFLSGVQPMRQANSLSKAELKKIYKNIVPILNKAISNRGTSFSDYVDANNKKGSNQEKLMVYGRGGKKCFICNSVLQKTRLEGRGTVYCKKCQK